MTLSGHEVIVLLLRSQFDRQAGMRIFTSMQAPSSEDGHRREANSGFTLNGFGKTSSAALGNKAEKQRGRFLSLTYMKRRIACSVLKDFQ